jgi:hypothetical protein
MRVATSAMTTLDADNERIHPARIKWVLSRVDVHDVTKEITDQAAAFCAPITSTARSTPSIDGAFAVIARNAPQPTTVLTSDLADLTLLSSPSVEIVKV